MENGERSLIMDHLMACTYPVRLLAGIDCPKICIVLCLPQ